MKTEIRLMIPTSSAILINGTFNEYTTGWITTGQTYTSQDNFLSTTPTVDAAPVFTTISNPTGWTWRNAYMVSQGNSVAPLSQNVDGLKIGSIYNIQFTVAGYEKMNSGNTLAVSLYGTTGSTLVTNNGRYSIDVAVENTGSTLLSFIPTLGFVGGVSNVSITPTTLYNEKLDLYDDDSFNLTFQIQTSIADKGASYSKTIRIPGTSNNNRIFDNLMDIGRYIDPIYITDNTTVFINKKIRAGIYSDSVELLIGYLELVKVIVSNTKEIEYECVFYSNIRSIADAIGEKLCRGNEKDITNGLSSADDLDFSEYDHVHTWSAITHTWNQVGAGYFNGKLIANYPQAKGIFYPVVDYANLTVASGNFYRLENFKPCIYVKEIWDKIFEKAGFTYTSTFLNSARFKSLVVPVGNKLDSLNLFFDDSKFKIGIWSNYNGTLINHTGGVTNLMTNYTWYKVQFDKWSGGTMFNGQAAPWNTGTYDWTISGSGVYNIQSVVNYNILLNGTGTTSVLPYVGSNFNGGSSIKARIRIRRQRGTGIQTLSEQVQEHNTPIMSGIGVGTPILSANTFISVNFSDMECYVGDKIWVEMAIDSSNFKMQQTGTGLVLPIVNPRRFLFYATNEVSGNAYSVVYNEPSNKQNYYMDGAPVYANDIVPKMKQLDFVKSIANKFNLMFAENKAITNDLFIEPYDNFYLTGQTNVVDWTWKVDKSVDSYFERNPILLDKDVHMSFKDDNNDFLLSEYKKENSYNFGDRYIKNLYLSDSTEKIQDTFSSTQLGILGSSNWIVSKIYKEQDDYKSGMPTDGDYNYRVLYRNILGMGNSGSINPSLVYVMTYDNTTGTTVSGVTTYTLRKAGSLNYVYPYAGVLDNPYTPTFDLNYGAVPYNLPATSFSQNNLMTVYWQKKLSLYLDINSKLLTCYIRLNNTDIAQLDFRKQFMIDNHLYRLQKIYEWNPNGASKVELIMVQPLNEATYILPQGTPTQLISTPGGSGNIVVSGGTTGLGVGVIIPPQDSMNIQPPRPTLIEENVPTGFTYEDYFVSTSSSTIKEWNNTISPVATGLVIGSSNIVEDTNFLIKGSDNYVYTKDVTLIDSSNNIVQSDGAILIGSNNNTILSGATGAFLINTNDQVISATGQTFINGYELTSSGLTGSSGTSGTNGTSGSSGTDGAGGTYQRGELAQGGIVVDIWVDGGYESALIMSLDNVSTGITFSNITGSTSGATSQYDGFMNSFYIVNQSGHTDSAALRCNNYSGGSVVDWYLPSNYEMIAIESETHMLNRVLLNNGCDLLLGQAYWTSTDAGGGNAFVGNIQYNYNNTVAKTNVLAVRAVRQWTNTP